MEEGTTILIIREKGRQEPDRRKKLQNEILLYKYF
jgi:hypothetical protein